MKTSQMIVTGLARFVAFVLAAFGIIAMAASLSKGAPICRQCVRPQRSVLAVVPQVNYATSAAYAYTPAVAYQVSPQLQVQGQQTYTDRRSPEFEQLRLENLQLKAWRAGFEAAQASAQLQQQPQAGPEQPLTPTPLPEPATAPQPAPEPELAAYP